MYAIYACINRNAYLTDKIYILYVLHREASYEKHKVSKNFNLFNGIITYLLNFSFSNK